MNFDRLNEKVEDLSKREVNTTTLRNQIQGKLMMEALGKDVSDETKVFAWIEANAKRISDAIEADPTIADRWANEPEAVLEELR